MLQARLGQLPPRARRVLRAASVFGTTFWEKGVKTLLAVTHGEEPVHAALQELIREKIIEKSREHRFAEEAQYSFRHALVRDAAYGLLNAKESVAWPAAAKLFLKGINEQDTSVLADRAKRGDNITAELWL